MLPRNSKRFMLLGPLVLLVSVVIVTSAYHIANPQQQSKTSKNQLSATAISRPTTVITPAPTLTPVQTQAGSTPTATPIPAPNPANVLGIDLIQGSISPVLAGYVWVIQPAGLAI